MAPPLLEKNRQNRPMRTFTHRPRGRKWGGGGGGGVGKRGAGEEGGGLSLDPCSFPQQLLCTQSMHFKLRKWRDCRYQHRAPKT